MGVQYSQPNPQPAEQAMSRFRPGLLPSLLVLALLPTLVWLGCQSSSRAARVSPPAWATAQK